MMNPLNKTHFEYNYKTERPDLVYTYRRIRLPKFIGKRISTEFIMKYKRKLLLVLLLGVVLIFWLYYMGLEIIGQIFSIIFLFISGYVVILIIFDFGITIRKAVITKKEHTEILRVGKKIDLLSFQWKDSCLYDNLFHVVSQEEYDKIAKEVVM